MVLLFYFPCKYIVVFFVYLIKLVVDVFFFFNNSIYFSLIYEPSLTLNLLKSQISKIQVLNFHFLIFKIQVFKFQNSNSKFLIF